MPEWSYHARLYPNVEEGVVDGDTMALQLDLGFYIWYIQTLRLAEVDTHEIHFVSHDSEEYERGMEEFEFVKAWFKEGQANHSGPRANWPFEVITEKYDSDGKYGRMIAYVMRKSDGQILNEDLLEEFENVEY